MLLYIQNSIIIHKEKKKLKILSAVKSLFLSSVEF